MQPNNKTRWTGAAGASVLGLALAAGFVAGSLFAPAPTAQADIRTTPRREAFQSGSERSETVLREIAATLTRLEGRVERIEKALTANRTGDKESPSRD